jgi:cytochrome oxidase Cu insertion factor (SCO1/SenC/PrrC family)
MHRHAFGGYLACLAIIGGCSSPSARVVRSMERKPAPDFELTDLEGATVRLGDLRGRPVVLAFFAYG